MASVKVIAEDMAFSIRKGDSFKIPEEIWREKVTSKEGLQIELATMDTEVIKKKTLRLGVVENRLSGGIYFDMKDITKMEGSGKVIIKKPGEKGFGDEGYNIKHFSKLRKSSHRELCLAITNYLQHKGIIYNQEVFLKNHLENGLVTVKVISEISVNGENIEDKKMKRKDKKMKRNEAVVRDINNFCKDKSSSDFLVISEGEEIPCHRIILCSR